MISGGSVPQIQNNPVYSLPHLYVQGMNISVASNTVIAIAPGQARDMNDEIDMPIGYPNLQGNVYPAPQYQNYLPPIFINSAVNGANGLDTGTLAASSNYLIYVIGDSRGYNQTAGLLSLYSNAYPVMPQGYDSYVLLGFVSTNGSIHFTAGSVLNYKNTRAFYLSPAVSVLSAGNATTFTGVDLNTPVPLGTDTGVIVYLQASFTPAAIGDYYQLRPTGGGTGTTNLVTVTGIAAGIAQTQYVSVLCGVNGSSHTSIDYLVSSSSDALTLLVTGYTYTTT
jgi:hypothetical protein